MRRGIVLGLLVAIGAASVSVAAYQQRGAAGDKPKIIDVEKLRDNLFVLRGMGGGGNTAVFVQANGVTVVDTKNPGWGAPILASIKELTPKPVTMIINTHTHSDHVSGNVEFPASVEVVVHENTAANMKEMRPVTGLGNPASPPPNIFVDNKGRGLPKRTFTDTMTLGSGADQITLHYFGRGHTNGDAWVLFNALKIVHAGDIFSGKNVPLLDFNNGGSGVAIPDTLAKAHTALSKTADTIITGHSTQMTMADLLQYSEYNREFLNHVRAGKKAGQSVEAIAKSWTNPPKYTGYADPAAMRLQANVQGVYNEIP